ncbi:MAG: T9SS type A sorting domain-containing protein [Bacteroidales bacterium]|nr:T9SS type A sorting domain-containing protein [Bacteroidales bacterium]
MKTLIHYMFGTTLLFFVLLFQNANADIWVVETSDAGFAPADITGIQVGDTIRWVWIAGIHTTTSAIIPEGAQAWDSPLTAEIAVFDYIPVVSGTYHYVCTPHVQFGMIGSFTVMGPSDISELAEKQPVLISPNPFREKVTVYFNDNHQLYRELKIYDGNGTEVRKLSFSPKATLTTAEIQLGDLSPGLYIFKFLGDNNNVMHVKGIRE